MRRGEVAKAWHPLAGWETVPGKLIVTRVTTGALSDAVPNAVGNPIPLAVGVRSHVLTRIDSVHLNFKRQNHE
jgi:hypothetical protein